jgi:hypothetical protein
VRIGYARTSTVEQIAGLEAQERQLWAAGADKVFAERLSSVAKTGAVGGCTGLLPRGRRSGRYQVGPTGPEHDRSRCHHLQAQGQRC